MELEQRVAQISTAMHKWLDVAEFVSGKFSIWLKFVCLTDHDGAHVEEPISQVQKVVLTANSVAELYEQIAENVLLTVFGAEVPIVPDLPNLIIKLFDHKARIPMIGAPPLDQEGQIFLKVTIYRYEPSLFEHLFGRHSR